MPRIWHDSKNAEHKLEFINELRVIMSHILILKQSKIHELMENVDISTIISI